MQSKAATVAEYLASLPEDRRAAIAAVREVFLRNIDQDVEERMLYGMIGYAIPHRVYPPGYHCDPELPLGYAGLASQKQYMSLYMMAQYCGCCGVDNTGHLKWFKQAWAKSGKKLDMGKSCIRFKKLGDLPLDVIAEAIRRVPSRDVIREYDKARAAEAARKAGGKGGRPKPKGAARKTTVRKNASKKAAR